MYTTNLKNGYLNSSDLKHITGINSDVDMDGSVDAVITWDIDIDGNSYGIKGLSVNVESVSIEIFYVINDIENLSQYDVDILVDKFNGELSDEQIEGSFDLITSEYTINQSFDLNWTNDQSLSLRPVDVNIDGKNKEITMEF